MSDVTLSYKGSDILELSDSGSATLKTGGKYCEDDIAVEYVKPSGGTSYTLTAVFDQTNRKIFDCYPLDVLKNYLTVTVNYSDSTSEVLDSDDYELSGTLTVGTSTITVTAMKATTTFTATVIHGTDVTPSISSTNAYDCRKFYSSIDNSLRVITQKSATYLQAYILEFPVKANTHYVIRADVEVDDPSSAVCITFMNPSNAVTIFRTQTPNVNEDSELYADGVPSEHASFVTPCRMNFYVTWNTASWGNVLFKNVQVIEYDED